MQNDTIAAIATAMSPSGIGIIRISGDDALSVIDRIYRSKNNKTKISACQSHTIHYGFIYDGDEKIDEVMVLLMKAPNTYTREDTVEIDCHGGVYVMKRKPMKTQKEITWKKTMRKRKRKMNQKFQRFQNLQMNKNKLILKKTGGDHNG